MCFPDSCFQIGIRQSRKGREDEPVPHPLQFGVGDLLGKQPFQLVEFQVAAPALGQFGMQIAIWIASQRPLIDCSHGHLLQTVEVFVYRLLLQPVFRPQKQVERIVELPVEAA